MEKDMPCKWKGKESWSMIVISDEIDFKTKTEQKKRRAFIMIKGSMREENIAFINIYAPNVGTPKYVKQILTDMKGKIDSNRIVGDF